MEKEKQPEELSISREGIIAVPFNEDTLARLEDYLSKMEPEKPVGSFLSELATTWLDIVEVTDEEFRNAERDRGILNGPGFSRKLSGFTKLYLGDAPSEVRDSGTKTCRIYESVYAELQDLLCPIKSEVKMCSLLSNVLAVWLEENRDILCAISSRRIAKMKKHFKGYSGIG